MSQRGGVVSSHVRIGPVAKELAMPYPRTSGQRGGRFDHHHRSPLDLEIEP